MQRFPVEGASASREIINTNVPCVHVIMACGLQGQVPAYRLGSYFCDYVGLYISENFEIFFMTALS